MPLSQADRIAFSSTVIAAPAQSAAIDKNKAAIQAQITSLSNLDQANANLFAIPNNLVNLYQPELSYIDGNLRTTITAQDISDAANKVLGNHFFPNNTMVSVPSLSAKNNVWSQLVPYALTYAIGKNYTESYGVQSNPELGLITTILGYSTSTSPTTVMATVNTYLTTLALELAAIPTDTNSSRQADNQTAAANISKSIVPALNTYLMANHPTPVTTTNPATGASTTTTAPDPSVTALQTAVNARQTFVMTRLSQLTAILGSITQDVGTGAITASSGAYGQRYNSLVLRLHILSGSLSQVSSLNAGVNAQTSLKSGILQNAATYSSYVPTSAFKSDGNNLASIHVLQSSLFLSGDMVYVMADGQAELLRAVKSINNDVIVLNDVVPSAYTVALNARIYKDVT